MKTVKDLLNEWGLNESKLIDNEWWDLDMDYPPHAWVHYEYNDDNDMKQKNNKLPCSEVGVGSHKGKWWVVDAVNWLESMGW
jgi:hypothetical protein